MSEQTEKVNEVLTNRVNNAYVAKDYTLLNGGQDNIVMIKGGRDNNFVDVLLTFDVLEELVETLKSETAILTESKVEVETQEQQTEAE